MRIARIFVGEPAGTFFDVAVGDHPLGALTRSWATDGYILPDVFAGPFIPWTNVILVMVYEADQMRTGTVVQLVPKDPKDPAA